MVRKAPSRWIASSFFQSANSKSTIGVTIWMPALLTSMSMRPNALTTVGDAVVDLRLVGDVHGDADRIARRSASISVAVASAAV